MLRFNKLGAACVLSVLVTACDFHPLDVDSPVTIEDKNIANKQGAELLRVRALYHLNDGLPGLARAEGILTDEFFTQSQPSLTTANPNEVIDRRDEEATISTFTFIHGARNFATIAIPALREFGAPRPYVGQMFAVRGFAKMLLAQDFCPGQAFNELDTDGAIVYMPPLSTDQAYESALADLDSAVVEAADSARILNFARVARARTLLELGRFADAAAAAAPVPTTFVFNAEFDATLSTNSLFNVTSSTTIPVSVADRDGGNGLDFSSSNDPRIKVLFRKKGFDGTNLYSTEKYPTNVSPVTIANGIEARLIEAEAALKAGDVTGWLSKLNALRATSITPAMTALTNPATERGRVDLMFRERAFWLFATAHRLGDMRRLVRHYGRTVAETFPSGTYRAGGPFGTVTTFKIPASELLNPAVTGCTER
jgi:starch-binding outer membrane protein, SusD/RagB family